MTHQDKDSNGQQTSACTQPGKSQQADDLTPWVNNSVLHMGAAEFRSFVNLTAEALGILVGKISEPSPGKYGSVRFNTFEDATRFAKALKSSGIHAMSVERRGINFVIVGRDPLEQPLSAHYSAEVETRRKLQETVVAQTVPSAKELSDALANLMQAVQFTPLGIRGLKACQVAEAILGKIPSNRYGNDEETSFTERKLVAPGEVENAPGGLQLLVTVSPDYVPQDGDQFDGLISALEHFEIAADVVEIQGACEVKLTGKPVAATAEAINLEVIQRKEVKTLNISIPSEMPKFANEQSFGPAMRVARLEQAIKAWRVADESEDDAPDGVEDGDYVIVCMLADFRHYCDAKGLDFAQLDRESHSDYLDQLSIIKS